MKFVHLIVGAFTLGFGALFGWILYQILAFSAREGFVFSSEFGVALALYGFGFAVCVFGFVRSTTGLLKTR